MSVAETVKRPRGELFFGVDARHIRQLGQELVGDRTTALTELIKNAYDADATRVSLRFDGAMQPSGVLEVEDDGLGMRLEDVDRGWMRISTDVKDVQSQSQKYRRERAGRKGIGRFATETLGRRLVLRTTVRGEPSALMIRFDWEADYPSGHDLTAIANPFWIEPAPKGKHGTLLRIEGLYDTWDEDARTRVRRAVRLLQPPFPVATSAKADRGIDPGFSVEVAVDGRPDDLVLKGYDDFLQAGTARMRARVSTAGQLRVRVASDHLGVDREEILAGRYRKTGAFSAEASYFVFRTDALGGVGVRVAQEMAKEFAGIRLYRDGLRVMPYGEQGNDWLGLDRLQGARTTLVPLANGNWFGQIAITRVRNPDLRDTASREGLVENEAFAQLQRAVRQALIWAASEVGSARQRKVTTSHKPGAKSRRAILAAARTDVERTVRERLPAGLVERVMPVVSAALEGVSPDAAEADSSEAQRVEELLNELELLRVLASLGTSIAVFSHEVRSALTASAAALSALDGTNASSTRLRRAQTAVDELQDLAGYIDAYVSASQRRVREPQPLANIIDDFTARLSRNLARSVKFVTEVRPPALRTAPMARSEIDAILINLLTNAIKAMDAEGHPERRVGLFAQGEADDVVVRFQDTGSGIDPRIREEIFEPFITDTRSPISELGVGTGLGLKIVRDIAEGNGGSVGVATPNVPYATCIEVRLPRWRKQQGGA